MKVTRAQAEENRRTVVEAAGRLFREHGVKGVGLAELMSAAGLTHGGFYKQFKSKDDLVHEACDSALEAGVGKWARIVEKANSGAADPLAALVRHYLSPSHRDRVGSGCALTGLGPDAVRNDPALRGRFERAVQAHAGILEQAMRASRADAGGDQALAAISTMVGALLLSRMVEDEAFSKRILDAASASLLERGDSPIPQHEGR
jgi:TetR/AcrR family transcriptional repressor of nem operon